MTKLTDDEHYKKIRDATCLTTAGFFSYFWAPAANFVVPACKAISDVVADPIHDIVHGKSYEEKNSKTPKPSP